MYAMQTLTHHDSPRIEAKYEPAAETKTGLRAAHITGYLTTDLYVSMTVDEAERLIDALVEAVAHHAGTE
jgi:hypothetical protein